MTPKRAFIWLVVSVLVVQVHQLFYNANWSGNIFPFEDYPQSFGWYVYTLGRKLSASVVLGVYAFREPCKWLSNVVKVLWLFETKEVFDYLLMANKAQFLYDVIICLLVALLFLLLELKKLNLNSLEYEAGYEEYDYRDDYF